MGFLEQVAVYMNSVYGADLHKFCIVFPNIRAGLFFKKYLAQLSDKPVWSPAFRSLESLFEEITGLTQADNLSLIFELFKTFRQHKATDESFDDFYFWGEMLLADFDEMDKQLVDARDLFRNVGDLKEIDMAFDYLTEEQKDAIRVFWQNFNGDSKHPLEENFKTIWQSLHPIYESFKQRLKARSFGYGGMIQREAVSLMPLDDALYEKYAFIGFNALTNCESKFFKSLQKQNRACFFWDYDDYYMENDWHEAGMFMRENIRRFPSEPKFIKDTDNLTKPISDLRFPTSDLKNIEIISVPSETGQAKLAGQLLEDMFQSEIGNRKSEVGSRKSEIGNRKSKIGNQKSEIENRKSDLSRTAVVLPDEHLLLPVLSALPEAARDINITMGYPFTCSPAYSLFERLVSLQQRARIYSDGTRFNHNDVCMILQHPYIQDIIPNEANAVIKYIIERNRIFIPPAEIHKIQEHELLQMIFVKCSDAREFSQYLLKTVSKTVSALLLLSNEEENGERDLFQLEYLYVLYTALQRIHDVLATDDIEMEITVFSRLLRRNFASLKIPFSGEPLKGLQLMGMLETRALDFDNVIILSMNEGIFPKNTHKQSFIPYNLRRGFGLATSERHDAISAYHFYRLIQRAENISLIYNSAATDGNTGEMSRFLSQLIYEKPFSVQRRNITFSVNIESGKSIVKERTEEVRRILGLYLSDAEDKKRLSPSAINSYLDCSLRFYFRYIEGLKENEEVLDEIDPSAFGKLLHKTMELIYKPYINTEITAGILSKLQKDKKGLKNALYSAFADEYFHAGHVSEGDITGRNIIIYEVLLKYVMRILEVDKNAAPFTVVSLEECLELSIPVESENGSTARLNISGFIDRLDFSGNTLRIIDYKTGNAQRSFSSVADLFDRSKTGNHAVLQTLVYAFMTRIAHPEHSRISSGLYIMKELFEENFDPRINVSRKTPIDNYFDVSGEFETELNRLLPEMFLSDTPFTQTENTKNCRNCLYSDICHRS